MMIDGINQSPAQTYFYQKDIIGPRRFGKLLQGDFCARVEYIAVFSFDETREI